jgi:hypothetical protein
MAGEQMTREEILDLIGDPEQLLGEMALYQRSMDYAQSHWPEIHARYANEFVAVYDGIFVGHASSMDELLRLLELRGVSPKHAYVRFVAPDDDIMILLCR